VNREFGRYANRPWDEINGNYEEDLFPTEWTQRIEAIEQAVIADLKASAAKRK
jgi:hypothetical protein